MDIELLIPIAFKQKGFSTEENMLVLAGDIGGTKANMALCRFHCGGMELIKEKRYVSKDHVNFGNIISDFIAGEQVPQKLCLSVAGPVIDGKVKFTNLSWEIDKNLISEMLGGCPVAILNDLEATAYGLAALKPSELHVLHKGTNVTPGNIGILAAGTGLGEAGLFFDGKAYHPFATEGGHADFAPRTKQDIAILNFLQARHEHVSWERLLSGQGIVTIWEFLTQAEQKSCSQTILDQMKTMDPAAVISNAAKDGSCPVCIEAIALFNRFLAIEAVNLILKFKATGGLYLAGGIAPKLLDLLDPTVWNEVFEASGRMRHLLAEVTVYVMMNEKAPMLGSIYYAGLNL
ncbi:MAG: glucokinase [Bacteroidetes bacterium 24-39-8]|jgi:glucokinase|nr:MAG: glucokinase [Sphingobacteriia bacterium 35-40-8]OYZ50930.1 MAG: glucokinase [Bacteroidetes bacterium 24-39-8]OZA67642.1 MAG: glucokinase [Sphingobacteriia bacterium 39-39-8]HQR91931.1 glucokinase [Sediminibacterium sp.]HQS55175.1 glucokinase [Sediminibacterium sp.]